MLSALPAVTFAQSSSSPAASDVQTIWDKPELEVRGLEIHSRRMWEWKSIMTAFSLMEKMNMNMLIFHQDNIQDAIVWPDKYFPEECSILSSGLFKVFTNAAYSFDRSRLFERCRSGSKEAQYQVLF